MQAVQFGQLSGNLAGLYAWQRLGILCGPYSSTALPAQYAARSLIGLFYRINLHVMPPGWIAEVQLDSHARDNAQRAPIKNKPY